LGRAEQFFIGLMSLLEQTPKQLLVGQLTNDFALFDSPGKRNRDPGISPRKRGDPSYIDSR